MQEGCQNDKWKDSSFPFICRTGIAQAAATQTSIYLFLLSHHLQSVAAPPECSDIAVIFSSPAAHSRQNLINPKLVCLFWLCVYVYMEIQALLPACFHAQCCSEEQTYRYKNEFKIEVCKSPQLLSWLPFISLVRRKMPFLCIDSKSCCLVCLISPGKHTRQGTKSVKEFQTR